MGLKILNALWIISGAIILARWLYMDKKHWNCTYKGLGSDGLYYDVKNCHKTEDWLGYVYGWIYSQDYSPILNVVTLGIFIAALYRISNLIKKLEHFGYVHNVLVLRMHIVYCWFTGIYSLCAAFSQHLAFLRSIKTFQIEPGVWDYRPRPTLIMFGLII